MANARAAGVVLVAVLFGAAGPAAAQSEASRYAARVEVPDQSDSARQEVLDEALERVLRRATGDPAVSQRSGIDSLLKRPGDFLQRFGYERVTDDDTDGSRLELVARFDGDSVRQALITAGVPVWQRDRLPVLVWAAVEDADDQRTLVGSDTGGDWREALVDAAAELGIELIFPLLDLEDQSQVRFSDVAGGFSRPVREASTRYDTPLVLMGSLRASDGQWRGRWRLFGPGDEDRSDWRSVETEAESALVAWRRELATRLRESYSVLPDPESSESLPVRITGVERAEDFGWIQETLVDLSGVTEVTLRRVEPERVQFALSVNVSRDRVLRTLNRNPSLERTDQGRETVDTPVAGPIYRLQR